MTRPPELTDRRALVRNRARARATGAALFLHEHAVAEVQERLAEVNRTFNAPAVVTPFPEVWEPALPGATMVSDDETLTLTPGAHDLVVHAMALHWAADPVGQIVQARHALAPDGLFMGMLFGGETLNELRTVLAEAEARLTGGLAPRVLPMGELRDLGSLLQRSGLALPVADSVLQTATYPDMWALMRDLRAMGEANALAQRHRVTPPRRLFSEAARLYADSFPAEGGRVRATFEMIFLTGWAPDASQPRPLRPGSASVRLADALDAQETPLPDKATGGH